MNIDALKIDFNKNEIEEITQSIEEILKCGKLYQGKYVAKFEHIFSNLHHAKYGIAVNSGSAAIEIPMRYFNVRNKEVLVPANTFIATALGVVNAGGKVRLVDSGKARLTPSLEEIKSRVTRNTAGVIVVHIGGIIQDDIVEIREWCDKKGLFLYEDCAHAHGSAYQHIYAGGFGQAGGFSMFSTKVITCGEGGIILTNDEALDRFARSYRNYGKHEEWKTITEAPGNNHRMSEITAAIAYVQCKQLNDILARRKQIVERYDTLLTKFAHDLGIKILETKQPCSYYKYSLLLPDGINVQKIEQRMAHRGIQLPGPVYRIPLNKQKAAIELKITGAFPNAENTCLQHICLPVYPSLKDEEIVYIANALQDSVRL